MSDDDRTVLLRQSGRVKVGTRLNGIYQVETLIGVGGMSEIYRGHNIQTQDPVAIKVVLPEFANDDQMVSLFRREALVLNRLNHEAIIRYHVFSYDTAEDLLYLAMEFVEGPTLRERIKQRPLSQIEACQLIAKVAKGMRTAHQEGVIHRDLATDNIILSGGDVLRPKVIDFGIARSSDVNDSTLIQSGFAGKYNYVSPEQIGLFGGAIGPASDIYSLGLVFAAALLGKPLDMSGSHAQVVAKRQEVPDLSRINPGVKPLIERMLQPNPLHRPQAMDDVVVTLNAILGNQRESTNTSRNKSRPAPTWDYSQQQTKRGSSTGIIAALLLLVALGGGGWWAMRNTATGQNLMASLLPSNSGDTTQDHKITTTPSGKSELKVDSGAAAVQPQEKPVAAPEPTGQPQVEPAGNAAAQPQQPTADTPPMVTAETEEPEAPPPVRNERPRITLDEDTEPAPAAAHEPMESASLQPPREVPLTKGESADAPSPSAWISQFNGGPCFLARSIRVASNSVSIEGFGTSVQPFETLDKDFRSTFGVEPKISMRAMNEAQCPVVDFVHAIAVSPSDIALTITNDLVEAKDTLEAEINGIALRHLAIFAVMPDGKVTNLTGNAHKSANGVEIKLPARDFKASESGYLLWTVASDAPLKTLDQKQAKDAAAFVDALRSEASERGAKLETTLKYFRRL